jgi:hypothetical protein
MSTSDWLLLFSFAVHHVSHCQHQRYYSQRSHDEKQDYVYGVYVLHPYLLPTGLVRL